MCFQGALVSNVLKNDSVWGGIFSIIYGFPIFP